MLDRNTIIRGPALVTHNSQTFLTKGDVTIDLNPTKFDIEVLGQMVDERDDDVTATITFTPAGEFSAAVVSALYPWANVTPGQSLFTGTDKTTVIQGVDGRTLTFAATAVTTMPPAVFMPNRTLFDACVITAVRKNNTAWGTANSFYTDEDGTFSHPALDRDAIPTVPYTFAWGASAPWSSIQVNGGVTFTPTLETQAQPVDDVGTIDMFVTRVTAQVAFSPVNPTVAQMLAQQTLQGTGAARGRSRFASANDFVASGGAGNPQFTLYDAVFAENINVGYGAARVRAGEVTLRSLRNVESNAWVPQFALAVQAA